MSRFKEWFTGIAVVAFVAFGCYAATGAIMHVNAQVRINEYEEVKRQKIIANAPPQEIENYTKMIASMKSKDTRATDKMLERLWLIVAGIGATIFSYFGIMALARQVSEDKKEGNKK